MIDKKGSEDEFHDSFGEDFELQDEDSASSTPSPVTKTVEKRRIPTQYLIAIGVSVILIAVSYFGYRFFAHRPYNTAKAKPPIVQPSAMVPVRKPPQATTAPISSPTPKELSEREIAQAFSSVDKSPTANMANQKPEASEQVYSEVNKQLQQLNQVLDKLNQQMENNLNQIKYLDSYTQEISKTMSKINESISAMDHRLLAVTNTTQNLSNEVGTVRSEVGQVKQVLGEDVLDLPPAPTKAPCLEKSSEKSCRISAETEYVVHAAIPGRVWLKSNKGQILTLTEGEALGNYGKILVIDAVNGVVLTSSGVTFR